MQNRILVVDDQADVRFLIRVTLELAGYRVAEAASGEEALVSLGEAAPDAMILDLGLPGIDGWEVLRQVRADASLADLDVIVCSAYEGQAIVLRTMELGCVGFIAKPFDPAELVALLESIRNPSALS
ncbi:MAG: response regulator [Actinomycetota bacterium]